MTRYSMFDTRPTETFGPKTLLLLRLAETVVGRRPGPHIGVLRNALCRPGKQWIPSLAIGSEL